MELLVIDIRKVVCVEESVLRLPLAKHLGVVHAAGRVGLRPVRGRDKARPSQRRDDGAGEKSGLAGHEVREARWRRDALRHDFGKMANKPSESLQLLGRGRNDAISRDFRDATLRDELSVLVEMEVEVVRKDDVGKLGLVAVELLLVGSVAVEIGVTDVLGLDIADRTARGAVFAHEDVGRAAFDARGLVHDRRARNRVREQPLERRTVAVLGRCASRELRGDFCDIFAYAILDNCLCHCFTRPPNLNLLDTRSRKHRSRNSWGRCSIDCIAQAPLTVRKHLSNFE